MDDGAAVSPKPKKGVNVLIKLFVFWHMFAMLSWSLPNPPNAVANGILPATTENVWKYPVDYALLANAQLHARHAPMYGYMFVSGLWQYWDMFAPNPSDTDLWWDAIVTYESGRVEVFKYPRIYTMPIYEKYFKERYRKYLERVNTDAKDSWKRPAFAQRVALLSYDDPNDPPVEVQLRRHWRTLESMEKGVPEKESEFVLFRYLVDQDKLRKDAGR
ncbi:MAG: hypothetical protein JST30_06870 [Armatimonadetes bacterium]|nr:hypothetical protein [Armatimonadota bacterium]